MPLDRRQFLISAACFALADKSSAAAKTHIVTLSFDDGFKRSFYRTAEIYESFGLRACLNVIALGERLDFRPMVNGVPDPMVGFEKGTFDDWNRLKSRGHEIGAHTYNHVNLTQLPLSEAKELIDKCAGFFETHLDGFKAADSVYNFAYNASAPELEQYALTKFLAVRTQGETAVNPIPKVRHPVRIGCLSQGPENIDDFLDKTVSDFLATPGGWLVVNCHGLDNEGWGPLSSKYLASVLKRLSQIPSVEILPAGEVVKRLPVT